MSTTANAATANGVNGNGHIVDADDGLLNVSNSETSKGGIKYEVILGEPKKVITPPRVASPAVSGQKVAISAELIQLRQETAAERRLSMEAEKRASLAEKLKRIEEAAKKREEDEANFVNTTKENLEKKIGAVVEKRETLINGLKTKLSNHHTNHLQEVRQNLETSLNEFGEKAKEDLLTKLEVSEKNREKLFQERLETLKKHDEKIELVRGKRNSSICDAGDSPTENSSEQ